MKTIIEQFRKQFPHKIDQVIDDFGHNTKGEIEAFILKSLKTQREEIVKDLEKMKMTKDNLGYVGELSNEHKVKNKTINQIIKILK